MRWKTPEGEIFASRFEYEVYIGLREQGMSVRRTTPEDSLVYTHPVRNGSCADCGSTRLVTAHTYTPDLYVDTGDAGNTVPAAGYYIEAKGYLRADRRALLRSFRKAWPTVDLRLVVQRDYRVTKSATICEWTLKYLRCPVAIWVAGKPLAWHEPSSSLAASKQ